MIDILLFCPRCGAQHVDAPESEEAYSVRLHESAWWELGGDKPERWTNPPHATHTCAFCGLLWRPSNENTNGAEFIPALEEKHLERITAAYPGYHKDKQHG